MADVGDIALDDLMDELGMSEFVPADKQIRQRASMVRLDSELRSDVSSDVADPQAVPEEAAAPGVVLDPVRDVAQDPVDVMQGDQLEREVQSDPVDAVLPDAGSDPRTDDTRGTGLYGDTRGSTTSVRAASSYTETVIRDDVWGDIRG